MPIGVTNKLKAETRTCALDGCDAKFTPRQANQLYCKPWHKNLARMNRRADEGIGRELGELRDRVAALEKAVHG